MGKKGCAIRYKKKNFYIPTVLKNAIDTIGCGDIFITLFSILQISKKFDINDSALISHIAAGVHANEHGNKQSINFLNLYKALEISFSTKCDPINPSDPVISIFIVLFY